MDMNITCPNCKTVNPGLNLFCQVCGARLTAAPATPTAPAPASYAAPVMPPAPPPLQAVPGQPPALTYQPPAAAYIAPSLKNLGVKVDDFGDIVPDMAARAAKVEETFTNMVKEKELPGVNLFKSTFSAGSKQRPYVAVTNPAGASMLVDFLPVGKDLSTNWSLYIKRPINWLTVGIVGGVAVLFSLVTLVFGLFAAFFGTALFYFFTVLSLLLMAGGFTLGLLGKILKDDPSALFIKDMDDIAWEDTNNLQAIVHDAMIDAVEQVRSETKPVAAEEKKTKKPK